MASLADITSEVRVLLKLLAASAVVVVILFFVFRGGVIFKNIFFPTPPAPPEQKFGILPKVEFPTQQPIKLTYNINTLTGQLPSFSDECPRFEDKTYCRMKIYKTKTKEPNLGALQTARENLSNAGFSTGETKIEGSIYQWSNEQGDRVQYDILSDNFIIISNYLVEPEPSTIKQSLTAKDSMYGEVMSFFDNIHADISDFDLNDATTTYLKLSGGQVIAADSQNDAQLARIDLFQKSIENKYKIHYSTPEKSAIYFVYENGQYNPRIIEAGFKHLLPDTNIVSTYPTKNSMEAYEDLKAGKAMVFNNGSSTAVDITEVTLGYYIGSEDQPYLLPIYVFKGKNFEAYVQALSASSIEN